MGRERNTHTVLENPHSLALTLDRLNTKWHYNLARVKEIERNCVHWWCPRVRPFLRISLADLSHYTFRMIKDRRSPGCRMFLYLSYFVPCGWPSRSHCWTLLWRFCIFNDIGIKIHRPCEFLRSYWFINFRKLCPFDPIFAIYEAAINVLVTNHKFRQLFGNNELLKLLLSTLVHCDALDWCNYREISHKLSCSFPLLFLISLMSELFTLLFTLVR